MRGRGGKKGKTEEGRVGERRERGRGREGGKNFPPTKYTTFPVTCRIDRPWNGKI